MSHLKNDYTLLFTHAPITNKKYVHITFRVRPALCVCKSNMQYMQDMYSTMVLWASLVRLRL